MKTLLIIGFAAALTSTSALASPCSIKIAQLQARYDASPIAAGAAPVAAATNAVGATETVDAKLHHQPSAGSAADADDPAMSEASVRDADFKVQMEQAKAALNSGDEPNCEASAAKAERALAR
jgi:hypothetical protein